MVSLYNIYHVVELYYKNQEKIPEEIKSALNLTSFKEASVFTKEKNTLYKIKSGAEEIVVKTPRHIKQRKLAYEKLKKYNPTKVFSLWDFIELAANIFQLTGSGLLLIGVPKTVVVATAIGLGSFFSWINILQYLRYSPRYYVLFRAIMKAFPHILKLMLGMMLLFVGYAFWGTAVFWEAYKFEGVNRAMLTLFAVINCDGIFFLFNDIIKIDYWMAVVYIVSFVFIFIYLVQNLFLQVVYKVYSSDMSKVKEKSAVKEVKTSKFNLHEKEKYVLSNTNHRR